MKTLKSKLILYFIVVFVPILILNLFLLVTMRKYSNGYNQIVQNITSANRININFKQSMDEKMYYIVIGNSSFEIEKPYELISDVKKSTQQLKKDTTIASNISRIDMIQRNLIILQKRIFSIEENQKTIGNYDKNIKILDNDIRILTALIEEGIQEYVYYEVQDMEKIRAQMQTQSTQTLEMSLLALVTIFLFAVIYIPVISESISRPIRQLCDTTNKVSNGDFNARAQVNTSDEVKVLSISLNTMIDKISGLIEDVKQEQRNLKNTELKLLQAQINPHFLYNTLDTIICLAESDKSSEVVRMVSCLSNFFRTTLSKGYDYITLKEEEKHIRSYLEIQHIRYSDILEYEIIIPQELSNHYVLKLTLQPIVENALYHGIKNKRGKGVICVSAVYENENIMLIVKDNGIGMAADTLDKVRYNIKNNIIGSYGGFGLVNVNERIRLNYGPEYGVQIESKLAVGTTVSVNFPTSRIKK